jgi:hypothetical protein
MATEGGDSTNRKKMDNRSTGRNMYIFIQSELHLPFFTTPGTNDTGRLERLRFSVDTQVQFE